MAGHGSCVGLAPSVQGVRDGGVCHFTCKIWGDSLCPPCQCLLPGWGLGGPSPVLPDIRAPILCLDLRQGRAEVLAEGLDMVSWQQCEPRAESGCVHVARTVTSLCPCSAVALNFQVTCVWVCGCGPGEEPDLTPTPEVTPGQVGPGGRLLQQGCVPRVDEDAGPGVQDQEGPATGERGPCCAKGAVAICSLGVDCGQGAGGEGASVHPCCTAWVRTPRVGWGVLPGLRGQPRRGAVPPEGPGGAITQAEPGAWPWGVEGAPQRARSLWKSILKQSLRPKAVECLLGGGRWQLVGALQCHRRPLGMCVLGILRWERFKHVYI